MDCYGLSCCMDLRTSLKQRQWFTGRRSLLFVNEVLQGRHLAKQTEIWFLRVRPSRSPPRPSLSFLVTPDSLRVTARAKKTGCGNYLDLNMWARSSDEVSKSAFRASLKPSNNSVHGGAQCRSCLRFRNFYFDRPCCGARVWPFAFLRLFSGELSVMNMSFVISLGTGLNILKWVCSASA